MGIGKYSAVWPRALATSTNLAMNSFGVTIGHSTCLRLCRAPDFGTALRHVQCSVEHGRPEADCSRNHLPGPIVSIC